MSRSRSLQVAIVNPLAHVAHSQTQKLRLRCKLGCYHALLWFYEVPLAPFRSMLRSSLGFAGTILLRSEEDVVFSKSTGPINMLAEVGLAW